MNYSFGSGLNYNFGFGAASPTTGVNYGFSSGAASPTNYTPPSLPSYSPVPQASSVGNIQPSFGSSSTNYYALAQAADKERQAIAKRDAERQKAVIGGYDQQMANSRAAGQQGYDMLAKNYDAIAADAAATRARNMGRIDQYGNSMRQDLAIKNQQALAAAQQSAIKRGLGNTTITDSLVRGQNFDNTRQMLTLEDQLLANRISTDSNLSGAYQNVLQNRATGLASQWNQNIANDNQLATNRLGYIGGIQENMDGFNTVANLYSQGLQMENQNYLAYKDRVANLKPAYYIGGAPPSSWYDQQAARIANA